jgi:integrase
MSLDVTIMTQEQASALAAPGRGKAVYFLWRGTELLYIGASTQVSDRVRQQSCSRDFGAKRGPSIPFDRATALRFETVREMVDAEKVLIERWWPPYNQVCENNDQIFGMYADRDKDKCNMDTMNAVFDRYERECIPKLGARTQIDYMRHLKILREHFGHFAPGAIKAKDVGRFLDVETGKIHRNKVVSVLSAVFSKAIGKWYIDGIESNPCLKVERNESHPRTRYVTDAEFAAVRAIGSPSVQMAMDLALLTGQRQSDIVQLEWINVWPTHIDITQGKTGKHLGIRITPAIADVLQRAYSRPPLLYRWFVIRTRTGEPYTPEGFRALWQRVMSEALRRGAIKSRFTFHDIRAKCASDKENLGEASALLGHSDQGLTRRIYKRSITMVDPLR